MRKSATPVRIASAAAGAMVLLAAGPPAARVLAQDRNPGIHLSVDEIGARSQARCGPAAACSLPLGRTAPASR